jgi:hypothetical protein
VPLIQVLMSSLGSAEDSTWASIKLTDGLIILNDERGACGALRQAARLARSPAQKQVVSQHDEILKCGL